MSRMNAMPANMQVTILQVWQSEGSTYDTVDDADADTGVDADRLLGDPELTLAACTAYYSSHS